MSVVWVVPVLVAALGSFAVMLLARAASGEARELAREIARFGELHVALTRVRTELHRSS